MTSTYHKPYSYRLSDHTDSMEWMPGDAPAESRKGEEEREQAVVARGERPFSMWCSTASTTTMASSTTRPMARMRPKSERVLMEKPNIGKKAKVPMSETGTAMS